MKAKKNSPPMGVKGIDAVPIPCNTLLQQERKTTAVTVRKKYILPTIAIKHDMIKSTGKMNTRFASHSAIVKKQYQIVKSDPVLEEMDKKDRFVEGADCLEEFYGKARAGLKSNYLSPIFNGVITIACKLINLSGYQQSQLIIMPVHTHRYLTQFGKISNF